MLEFLGLEEEAMRVFWGCLIMGLALGIETGVLAGDGNKADSDQETKASVGHIVLLVACIILGVIGFLIGILPGIVLFFTFQWKYILGAVFAGVIVSILTYFLARSIVIAIRRTKYLRNPIVAEAVAFCKQHNVVGVQCFADGMRFFTAIEHPAFCKKLVTLEMKYSYEAWYEYKTTWQPPDAWAAYDHSPHCIRVLRFADHGYGNVPDLEMFAKVLASKLHFAYAEHNHRVQYDTVTTTASTRTTTHNIAILHEDFFVYCPKALRRTEQDWQNRGLLTKPAPAKSTPEKPKKKNWE